MSNKKRKQIQQHPRGNCYFCQSEGPLESHHIVPKRHGGSDKNENLVDVCPTCHQRLERLYNKSFYDELNVDNERDRREPVYEDHLRKMGESSKRMAVKELVERLGVAEVDDTDETHREGICKRAVRMGICDDFSDAEDVLSSLYKSGDVCEDQDNRLMVRHD